MLGTLLELETWRLTTEFLSLDNLQVMEKINKQEISSTEIIIEIEKAK